MKNITKDNKGITLVALMITIVVVLIIVSIGTYSALTSIEEAKFVKTVTELQLIQQKVDELVGEKNIEELKALGESQFPPAAQQSLKAAIANGEVQSDSSTLEQFTYFSKAKLLEQFNIEDSSYDVMINFYNRDVVIVSNKGIKYKNGTYFTQYKLPNAQTIVKKEQVERNLEFNVLKNIDGINAIITITDIQISNGTLSYKNENDGYWNTITNYTERNKDYTVSIDKSGNYEFKIEDNTSENETSVIVIIELVNKPVLGETKTIIANENDYDYSEDSRYWIYAQDSQTSLVYVWVPKFAYKEDNTDIKKFIRGTTNIATDNTYINITGEDSWIISNNFENVTGIWVQVNSIEQSGLNIVQLLNNI